MGKKSDKTAVTAHLPEQKVNALDELRDITGWSRARLVEMGVDNLLESNADALTLDAEMLQRREQLVEDNEWLMKAVTFRGRLREQMQDLFTGEADPRLLPATAESWKDEARMVEEWIQRTDRDLEALAADYGVEWDYTEGEYVEFVENTVKRHLEAASISNYRERDEYADFSGVRESMDEEEFYARQVRLGVESIERFAEKRSGEELNEYVRRRLPEVYGSEDVLGDRLPPEVTLDTCAEHAAILYRIGYASTEVHDVLLDGKLDLGSQTTGHIPDVVAVEDDEDDENELDGHVPEKRGRGLYGPADEGLTFTMDDLNAANASEVGKR